MASIAPLLHMCRSLFNLVLSAYNTGDASRFCYDTWLDSFTSPVRWQAISGSARTFRT